MQTRTCNLKKFSPYWWPKLFDMAFIEIHRYNDRKLFFKSKKNQGIKKKNGKLVVVFVLFGWISDLEIQHWIFHPWEWQCSEENCLPCGKNTACESPSLGGGWAWVVTISDYHLTVILWLKENGLWSHSNSCWTGIHIMKNHHWIWHLGGLLLAAGSGGLNHHSDVSVLTI